jgi:hypothetical protein
MWNRLLIFLHLRRDWVNELDCAPPAFDSVPHEYDSLRDDGVVLTCCVHCGGGPRHAIHKAPGYCHHPLWMRCPACDPKRKLDSMPGPWGKVHARSLEEEQRRTDNGER